MTMSVDQLSTRLVIEQGWQLVADTDDDPVLPDEEEYWERVEATEDPEQKDEILVSLLQSEARLHNGMPKIGGPLPDLEMTTEQEDIPPTIVLVSPALRPLRDHCSRLLVKVRPNAIRITMLCEQNPPLSLSEEALVDAGVGIRQEIVSAVEAQEPADDSSDDKKQKRQISRVPVCFEVMVVGSDIQTGGNQRVLEDLHRGRIRKPQVSIHGFLVDNASGEVWSTNRVTGWRRRGSLKYALAHSDETAAEIRNALATIRPSFALVVASIAVALMLSLGLKVFVVMYDVPVAFWLLGDILIPSVVIITACSLSRVNMHAVTHTKRFLAGYLGILAALFLAVVWPPSFGAIKYMAVVGFTTCTINMTGAYFMEIE